VGTQAGETPQEVETLEQQVIDAARDVLAAYE
jgi:hypothetical protein